MKTKPFQAEDLARLALHDGSVLGWDTGLGKTLASLRWPMLKLGFTTTTQNAGRYQSGGATELVPKGRVLLVVPGDLHAKTIKWATEHNRTRITVLDCQATYDRLIREGGGRLRDGFYITSYTQLCTNGVEKMPDPDKVDPGVLMDFMCLKPAHIQTFYDGRATLWRDEFDHVKVNPAGTYTELVEAHKYALKKTESWADKKKAEQKRAAIDQARDVLDHLFPRTGCAGRIDDLDKADLDWLTRRFLKQMTIEYSENVGCQKEEGDGGPYCIYSPALADLSHDQFDCVVVDEGVKIKGTDTGIGRGVRKMNPRFRLVMTGTPIKNRLPDIFWLIWWATGGRRDAHARFPYSSNPSEQEAFADTFLVSERNLTKEKKSETKRRYVKRTAEVCNIHKLWKMLGPVLLRRRKSDCGVSIPPKIRQVVRVPMGKAQAATYQYHLHAKYVDCNLMPAPGAKLQALRIVAADPTSPLLEAVPGGRVGPPRSGELYTPKLAATLQLIAEILERGEQVLVGSTFHDPLDTLSGMLKDARIPHHVLDGRMSQKKRGMMAVEFMAGKKSGLPVALGGMESMAEGHDFYLCPNVILTDFSWAYDKVEQFINRVHRMTSPGPVNVYSIVCEGTTDRVLEASIYEKGDAADLVLDGKLLGERAEELNLAELLAIAASEFDPNSKTVCEKVLRQGWSELRNRLDRAGQNWTKAGNAIEQHPQSMATARFVPVLPAIEPAAPAVPVTASPRMNAVLRLRRLRLTA